MDQEPFQVARAIEADGWEYNGINDAGEMTFTRTFRGVTYGAKVSIDR